MRSFDRPDVPMMIGLAKTVVSIVLDMAFLSPWRITAGTIANLGSHITHARRSSPHPFPQSEGLMSTYLCCLRIAVLTRTITSQTHK